VLRIKWRDEAVKRFTDQAISNERNVGGKRAGFRSKKCQIRLNREQRASCKNPSLFCSRNVGALEIFRRLGTWGWGLKIQNAMTFFCFLMAHLISSPLSSWSSVRGKKQHHGRKKYVTRRGTHNNERGCVRNQNKIRGTRKKRFSWFCRSSHRGQKNLKNFLPPKHPL